MAEETQEAIVQLLTGIQGRLYAYIMALLPDGQRAADVLQETNLVLWRRMKDYQAVTNFGWCAAKLAHLQVLEYRKKQRQDRVLFDEGLLGDIAVEATGLIERENDWQEAFRHCLGSLRPEDRALVDQRYRGELSVQQMAEKLKRTAGALSQQLYRIRQSIQQCMEMRLAGRER